MSLPHFISLTAADPASRIIYAHTLSPQKCMERLFADIDDEAKRRHQDSEGNFKDVCDWYDMFCNRDGVLEKNS